MSFTVSAENRTRLDAVIFHPSSPQKHVWRCRIVLLSADGRGTAAIMAATAKSKTCVWRWQERFMHEGAINRFIAEHNDTEAKPFIWRADPDEIIAARNRGFQMLDQIHWWIARDGRVRHDERISICSCCKFRLPRAALTGFGLLDSIH